MTIAASFYNFWFADHRDVTYIIGKLFLDCSGHMLSIFYLD